MAGLFDCCTAAAGLPDEVPPPAAAAATEPAAEPAAEARQLPPRTLDPKASLGHEERQFAVIVHHQFVARVLRAVGGKSAGDLDGGAHGHKNSRYLTLVGARSPAGLSPVARQQISAAYHVPHCAHDLPAALPTIIAAVGAAAGPGVLLRIDAVPKRGPVGEQAAAALLAALGADTELTRSAGKSTLVLNLVRVSGAELRWGLVDGAAARALRAVFNDRAAAATAVVPMNPVRGWCRRLRWLRWRCRRLRWLRWLC